MEDILKQILSRLDGIDQRLGGLEEGQRSLEEGQKVIVQRLDNLEAGQARIEKKLDATFEQVGKNTEKIAELDAKLSGEIHLQFLS